MSDSYATRTNPFSLHGRTIAVVGAGAGIGRAVALACADAGATVRCLDLDEEAATETRDELNERDGNEGTATAQSIDVGDATSVDDAFASLLAQGPLHGVASTPGINVRKALLDYTEEDFERVIRVNLGGALHVLRTAGSALKEAGSGGSIVLFSSIRSLVVEPGQGVYAATKAGIVQMVRTLAAELGGSNIRVNAVAPGVVETPLTAPIRNHPEWHQAYATKNALGRWAQPEEMAAPTVFLLSDAASYITGSVLFVDGGWTAVDGRFAPPGI